MDSQLVADDADASIAPGGNPTELELDRACSCPVPGPARLSP